MLGTISADKVTSIAIGNPKPNETTFQVLGTEVYKDDLLIDQFKSIKVDDNNYNVNLVISDDLTPGEYDIKVKTLVDNRSVILNDTFMLEKAEKVITYDISLPPTMQGWTGERPEKVSV